MILEITIFFLLFSITGPALPFGLKLSAMAETPNGKGVLLFGGSDSDGHRDRILELQAGANSWNILNNRLKFQRYVHVVIPLQ